MWIHFIGKSSTNFANNFGLNFEENSSTFRTCVFLEKCAVRSNTDFPVRPAHPTCTLTKRYAHRLFDVLGCFSCIRPCACSKSRFCTVLGKYARLLGSNHGPKAWFRRVTTSHGAIKVHTCSRNTRSFVSLDSCLGWFFAYFSNTCAKTRLGGPTFREILEDSTIFMNNVYFPNTSANVMVPGPN